MRKALIAFLLACGGGWQPNPSHHYHLEIAPGDFSSDQVAAILDAANEWQSSSDAYVTFDGAPATEDTIVFHARTPDAMLAEFGGGAIGNNAYEGQSSNIDLVMTLDAETFHQTVIHEIGHALGLIHTTPGTIMCANTQCATLIVTCGDLNQLMGHTVDGCFP